MPGLLGPYERFRERFELPIVGERRRGGSCACSAIVGPFVLRRRKADVLTDLPDKLESIRYTPARTASSVGSTTRARAAPARGADRARRGRTPHGPIDRGHIPMRRRAQRGGARRAHAACASSCCDPRARCSRTTRAAPEQARRHHGAGGRAPWKLGEKALIFSPVHELFGRALRHELDRRRYRAISPSRAPRRSSERVASGERSSTATTRPCSLCRSRPAARV